MGIRYDSHDDSYHVRIETKDVGDDPEYYSTVSLWVSKYLIAEDFIKAGKVHANVQPV